METVSETRCFDGVQGVYRHTSKSTGTDMTFGLYLPPKAKDEPVPLLVYLSGLTCTHENVVSKAGAQRMCSEQGIAFLAPDTSPRGLELPGEHQDYDFGSGAGFYVDATEVPWSTNYRMYTYISREILDLVGNAFSQLDMTRIGITGHSMGGHGALTIALKNPDRFASVSAFAPICSPLQCPWGDKALTGYLGPDRDTWRLYDACALIEDGARVKDILVDQGMADGFLVDQLKPELLETACAETDIDLRMNRREGYDHSYYFIASFIDDHVKWASSRLN